MFLENISKSGSLVTIKEGYFPLFDNHRFNIDGIDFLILERKKFSPVKPKFYIMAKTQPVDKYVSSMYQTKEENIFKIEYRGFHYRLKIIQGKGVFITVISKGLK